MGKAVEPLLLWTAAHAAAQRQYAEAVRACPEISRLVEARR